MGRLPGQLTQQRHGQSCALLGVLMETRSHVLVLSLSSLGGAAEKLGLARSSVAEQCQGPAACLGLTPSATSGKV